MYVLIKTQPTTETHTFGSVYDLLTHVTHLVTKKAALNPDAHPQPPQTTTKPNISEALKNFQDKTQVKNVLIDEKVFEHEENKDEIRARMNDSKKPIHGPVRPEDIRDLHTFFLEHMCQTLSSGKMDLLEITHGWDQFVSFPHKFLTTGEQCVWVPRLMAATKDALVGVPPKPKDSYVLRRDTFQEYHTLVENVCTLEADAAGCMKPVIQDMCCKTLKALWSSNVKSTDLDPWIQFFVKSRLTKQKGLEVQSSVLFQSFSAWLTERVPSFGFISVQHFSSRMKSIHGFTTHRKASGVFYENVGFTPEKEKETDQSPDDTESLLHEDAEPPSAWPPSDEEKTDLAPPFETQWAPVERTKEINSLK